MRVQGSTVVVTGASSGIGRETAVLLAAEGARVWAVARSAAPLEELAANEPRIIPFPADVTRRDDRIALVEAAGRVDVLVNNAGIGWAGLVEEMDEDDVRELFEVNVLSLIDLTRRVLPGMLERRSGHIVNVASVASWVATPPLTVYSATKFAVQGFTEGLRREMAGRGVTVSSVHPAPTGTRFGHRARKGNSLSEEMPDTRMPGVPATLVARAILRSTRLGGLPWYESVAVPRAAGLSRLGAVPGIQLTVGGLARVARRAPWWRR